MAYRVVIPRSIPFDDSNRVQREVWKRGYSTRLAGRDVAQPDHLVVEFLRTVDELPEPGEVPGLEQDLERILSGGRIHAPFMGRGGWVETVQNRPPRATKRSA
jgi:hypothetical protein